MGEVPSFLRPLEWVAETINKGVDALYRGPEAPMEYQAYLPYPIRDKFRRSETGNIDKRDLGMLLQSGWYDQVVYLVVKALDGDIDTQREILEQISASEASHENVDDLKIVLQRIITDVVPDGKEVQAGKLAQVSRSGQYNFADAFLAKAELYRIQHKEPYVVAYASLQGLRYFNRVASRDKSTFGILVPSMISNKESGVCGYKIDWSSGSPVVTELPKDFSRPANSVIFDETRNTGNVLKQMGQFWSQNGNVETSFDCIVDVSARHAKDK